jgi:hypothetical protein
MGADNFYDTREILAFLRISGITPYAAVNFTQRGGLAMDGRTARHQGYA